MSNQLFGQSSDMFDVIPKFSKNRLIYGDNLTIMRTMPNACVDLIYLDPPFNSQRNYNLIYKKLTGMPVPEQEVAFCDAWEMDAEKNEMAKNMPIVLREYGVDEGLVLFWKAWIDALRNTQPRMLAYLIYMTYRLFEMRRILKPTGSIYLHCDPTASHYIKVIMDGVFGHNNFKNEIIWHYRRWTAISNKFQRLHDVILFYSKNEKHYAFNTIYEPYGDWIKKDYGYTDEDGKRWRWHTVKGNRYKVYLDKDKGVKTGDVWQIPFIGSTAKERLGYPTQKPSKLLERIIKASSNEGDVIFDPFCGCGTTIYASHLLQRRWIGCDIAILSIRIIQDILYKRYGLEEKKHYEVDGIPLSAEGAEDLFNRDPRQFQHWAVELAGGFCSLKYSGDKGIDGRIYFEVKEGLKNMVISVKGGKLSPQYTRELIGLITPENGSEMAGLICLQPSTKGMHEDIAKAGFYELHGRKYNRLQIRTIQDLLDGKRFDTPSTITTLDKEKQGVLPLE